MHLAVGIEGDGVIQAGGSLHITLVGGGIFCSFADKVPH